MSRLVLMLSKFCSGWQGRLLFGVSVLAVLIVVLAACTGKSERPSDELGQKGSPPTGNQDAYCAFYHDLYEDSKKVDGEQASIALIKKFEPRFNQALADAPADIKPDVQLVLKSLREVAAANDHEAVSAYPEDLSDAGKRLDTYCGIPG